MNVLDYRKQTELSLGFPAAPSGEEGSEVTFTPTVKASNGLERIELDDSALLQAGGQVISVSNTAITVRMPVYQPQPVRLSGVAVDRKGNRSNVAETLLTVIRKEIVLTVTPDKTTARADGRDPIVVTLHLTDSHKSHHVVIQILNLEYLLKWLWYFLVSFRIAKICFFRSH